MEDDITDRNTNSNYLSHKAKDAIECLNTVHNRWEWPDESDLFR